MWKDNLLLPGNKGVRSGVAVIMACIGAGGGGEEGGEITLYCVQVFCCSQVCEGQIE